MVIASLESLGEQIRARRLELGLTQGDLAERIGSTRQWLSRLERGKEGASIQRLLVMFDVLQLRFTLEMSSRGEMHPEVPTSRAKRAASSADSSYPNELIAKAEAAIAERLWRDPATPVEKAVER